MRQNDIFQTQNTALAVTLATCGIPIPKLESGKYCPFLNVYNAEILAKLGYRGLDIETAVRTAHKEGKPGDIFYNFVRCPDQSRVCKAFGKQESLMREAERHGDGPTSTGTCTLNIDEAARFAAQLLTNRKKLASQWLLATPFILLEGEVTFEPSDDGETATVVGSFTGYFLNASPAIRDHLRL